MKKVVFLHGWGSSSEVFLSFKKDLHEFDVITIDLPGFGKEPLLEVWGIDDYVQYLERLFQDQKIYALVGHSFGGKIAVKLAPKIQCEKLILIGSSGLRKVSLYRKIKVKLFKCISFIIGLFSPSLVEKLKSSAGSTDYKNANPLMRKVLVKTLHENLEIQDFEKIQMETLLIWGKQDLETPLWQAKLFNKYIKNSGLVLLDTGHYPFLENYFAVLKILEYFLKV